MIIYNTMPKTGPMASRYYTFFDEESLGCWKRLGEVRENPYDHQMTAEELCREARDAEILLCGWGQIPLTEEILARLPRLKLIAYTGGTVVNLLDHDGAAYRRGIRVLSGNDLYGKTVAEGCLCYTLSSLREMEKYLGEVRETGWIRSEWNTRGLFGKKVGLISFGTIARNFAKMLKAFDLTPLVYSGHMSGQEAAEHGVEIASLERIFTECDVISVHSARTPETIGMINRQLIESMKEGALLVNTSRGEVVDQDALLDRLKKGEIYAALDVYIDEADIASGNAENPFKDLKNVIPMPHLAAATDFRRNVVVELALDAQRFLNGQPMRNEINQGALSRMTR